MIAATEQVKVAPFMKKRDANTARIEEAEAELKALETPSEPVEAEPANKEEATFKKRYGDLRRHSQQKEAEFQKQLDDLRGQLEAATRKEIKLPKSEAEVDEWARNYPDVAAIVETIAMKKAKEMTDSLNTRMKKVDEMEATTKAERTKAELMRLHPDFETLKDSDDFHDWMESQPLKIQNAVYENDDDAESAAAVIDLFKLKTGYGSKKPAANNNDDAARAVNTRTSRTQPTTTDRDVILESDVKRMSDREYEANEEKIMNAMRSGKFVYDVSGNAR